MLKITPDSTKSMGQNLKILIDELKERLDENNEFAEKYFSYLKDNEAAFNDYLKFLEECVLSQLNEKYKGNEKNTVRKKNIRTIKTVY